MALTKADIIAQLTNQLGLTRKQASDTTETLIEIIKSTLASGDDVLVGTDNEYCDEVRDFYNKCLQYNQPSK